MKRFLFFLIATIFAIQGWSQATLNEGFEGVTFPPDDWRIETTAGGGTWSAVPYYPHTGEQSAVSGFDPGGGYTRWLITPKLSVTSTSNSFSFWIATNIWYPYGDNVDILVSTTDNDPTSFSSTPLLSLNQNTINTNWAQHTVSLSAYVGQQIYIAIRVIDNSGFDTYIDDVTGPELVVAACPKPTSLITSNPTSNGMVLGWTSPTTLTWNIQYMLASESDWANATTISGTTNPYTFTTLNTATSYKARVQTNCGTDVSDWSSTITFTTSCDLITAFPYTENFDGLGAEGSFPICWSRPVIYDIDYPKTSFSTSRVHSAPASLEIHSANTSPTYAITPPMGEDINTLRVKFWAMAEDLINSGTIEVGVMSDPNNLTTFESVQIIQPTTDQYTQYEVSFSNTTLYGAGKYIAFRQNPILNWYYWIDDVVVDRIPSCPDVQGLIVEASSTTTVSVNWNDVGDAGNGYNIAYAINLTGVFDPSLSATTTITTGTALPYTLQGFNPGDSVWVAVQRGCLGSWTEAIKVNLPTSTNTLPLIADFEDPTQDNVWVITNASQTNKWYIGSLGANDSDPSDGVSERGLYISSDLGVSSNYETSSASVVFVSAIVQFNDSPAFELNFDWSNMGENNWDGINVYLLPLGETLIPGTLPSSQYMLTSSYLTNAPTFQRYTQALSASYANTVRQLVFAWNNDAYGGTNPPAKIDNISLVALSCGMPYGLAMDSASYNGTEVYLRWTEPQGAGTWIVEYQQTGTSLWNEVEANSNPFTLTGLMPGTPYEARVRSICSTTDTSSISNVISFHTLCVPLTVPTPLEEFLTSVPPTSCWQQYEGLLPSTGDASLLQASYGWFWSDDVTPHNAKLGLYYEVSNWLVSPSIDLGDGSITSQLEFDLFYTSFYSEDLPAIGGVDDRFAVVISTDNGATWNATNATIWSNAPGTTRVLDNVTNIPTRIILPLYDSLADLPYTGIVKIGFYGESTVYNTNNDIHIDNFEVKTYSTCQVPTGVAVANISSTGATINFTENGTSTSWEYVYGETTIITDPANGTPIVSTTHPFQLTGLSPQTQYNVWVRSICDNGYSGWSNLYSFTTVATPAVAPYTYGFEDVAENALWKSLSNGVNKWAIGTAAGNGSSTAGTKANYISNDNGVSYAMSYGSIYSYTYRDIDFGTNPSSFGLTFDWKCQGHFDEWGNELSAGLIVYLRDPSEAINSSGLPLNPDNNLGIFYDSSTWETAELAIDNVSGVKRLMFVYFDTYSNTPPPGAIDNISINVQSCPRPFDVVVSNLTTTSAEISWSHPSATSYIVSYRTNTIGSTLSQVATTSTMHTIQNLTFGTQYIVGVKAICNGDTTISSELIVFITECTNGAISSFPWIEGFESGLYCWQQEYVSGTIGWTNTSNYNSAHSGTGFANFFNASMLGNKTKLISPELDLTGLLQPRISFWHKQPAWGSDQDELKVFYRTSSSGLWTELVHYTNDIASYVFDSLSLPNPSATYQIAFEAKQNWAYGVALDDIAVYDGISNQCPPPTNIIVIPSNMVANMTWTPGAGEALWEVRLGTTGTAQTVSTPNHILTGLTPNTPYTVYVRANCGIGYSSWESAQFTTTNSPTPPIVTTAVPTTQLAQTTAIFNGTYQVTFDTIQTKGFEYKEASSSTWVDQVVTTGTTPFTYSATGLTASTAYEAKAYVTTATDGRVYGNTVAFTTLAIVAPTVTTISVVNITTTSATFNGKVIQNTEAIEARGFEYKKQTEAWEDGIVISATGVTDITATPTTLEQGQSYEVRAYARTLSGKTYGQVLPFVVLGLNGVDGNDVSIMMYPNPATSQTKLVVSGINGETKVVLTDVQGRVLNTINAKPVSGTIEQTIDLNNLAKGIYYIRIQNSDINRTQKLIVK